MSSTEIDRSRTVGGVTHMALFILLALGLFGCYSRKNHLLFPSGNAAVADSIEVMCRAMDVLCESNGGFANYVVNWNGHFLIGRESKFASIEAGKQCPVPPMQGITKEQWGRFMNLVEFLNKNGLSSCRWDITSLTWSMEYLYDPDEGGREDRDVVYVPNDSVRRNIMRYCDVFQEEGHLMLVHHRSLGGKFHR